MNPSITCPADTTSSTTQVTWQDPMASDNIAVTPTVVCNRPSGSTFTVGQVETVTCTATDEVMLSETCTFTVTIGIMILFVCPFHFF